MIARLTLGLVLLSALLLGANRPMWWILLAVGVAILFALQVAKDIRQGLDQVALSGLPLGILFLAVLAWSLVQSLWPVPASIAHPVWLSVPHQTPLLSADPIGGLHHVTRLAAYGMIFWIALRHSVRAQGAEVFLKWIAIFVTLLSTFGIVAVVTASNPLLGELASGSVSASFVNRNNFATFAAMGLLANLTLYHQNSGSASRDGQRQLRDFLEAFFDRNWIYASGVLLCLAAILMSESRAGLAATGFGLATFYFTRRSSRSSLRSFAAAFILLLVGFSFSALSSGVLARIFAHSGEEARFLIYPLVVDGIQDRPLLGHGLGAFQDAFRVYVTPELARREIDLAHSSYLENAFEMGLPIAALFYGVLATIVFVLFRGSRNRRQNTRFPRFALGVAATGGFHAFFDFSLQIPAIAALFAFILGIGWAQAFKRT